MGLSRNQQLAAIAIIGLTLIGLGIGYARSSFSRASNSDIRIAEPGYRPPRDVEISIDQNPIRRSPPDPGVSIIVHVAGRVRNPNVYRLPPGSRVAEAINAAGGPLSDSNLDAVNLAAKVKDGERVFVPTRTVQISAPPGVLQAGSSPPAPGTTTPSAGSSGKLTTPGQGIVNINTADLTELQRLPGVGPSTAQKIIDHRNTIGAFRSVEQLMDVKGIGPKKLEKMRPFVGL